MLPYCLKCRKNMQSKNPEVVKIKKRKNDTFINILIKYSCTINSINSV